MDLNGVLSGLSLGKVSLKSTYSYTQLRDPGTDKRSVEPDDCLDGSWRIPKSVGSLCNLDNV